LLFTIFTLCLGLVIYHLFLFPVILLVAGARTKKKNYSLPETLKDYPTIEIFIASRNEEACIAEKIKNSKLLDYPKEKLKITVLANGCSDNTCHIVKDFSEQGIGLLEYDEIGKTESQNRAVETSKADIIVFSDANTLYKENALLELIKPFTDEKVGAVSGRHLYLPTDESAGSTENTYWNVIEVNLKKAEAKTGGLIGANGSIYAIRRELYVKLPASVISDFWEPLMIAFNGYRTEYAPDAISFEHAETKHLDEYKRKERIVQRSAYSLLQFPWTLNPLNNPRLSWLIFSHKVLRWLTPVLLIIALISSFIRLVTYRGNLIDGLYFAGSTIIIFIGLIGHGLIKEKKIPVVSHIYYILLMFKAAILGVFKAVTKGEFTVWDHNR